MATISSENFSSRAGSGSIDISHSSLTNSGSETFEVSDIGTIRIEFDIEENTNESDSLYFLPEKFTFSAFDGLSAGSSLFNRIDTDLNSTDEIEVSFSFTTDGGHSWTDKMTTTKNDINYDRERREVTFECYSSLVPFQTTVSDVFSTYSGDVFTFYTDSPGTGDTKDCMSAKDFIENMLNSIAPSYTPINSSNSFSDDPFVDGNDTWVVFKDHDGAVLKQTDDSLTALYRLAAVDGSIIGKIMGYVFFIYRRDASENVYISEDDVLGGSDGVKINPGLQNYRALSVWAYSVLGTANVLPWGSHTFNSGDADGLNSEAKKELHVSFYMLELQPASWNQVAGEFDDDGFVTSIDTGAYITEDLVKGAIVVPINTSSGLSGGDHFWFSDKRELYEVDSATASRIFLKTPLRRDVGAEFTTGGNKGIQEEVGASRANLSGGAVDAYRDAYGADGSRLISVTVLDIDTLGPHQVFTFDSSWPDVLAGQTYRPSMLEYDLKSDFIKIEGYQIG